MIYDMAAVYERTWNGDLIIDLPDNYDVRRIKRVCIRCNGWRKSYFSQPLITGETDEVEE